MWYCINVSDYVHINVFIQGFGISSWPTLWCYLNLDTRFFFNAAAGYDSPSSPDVIVIKHSLCWQYFALQKFYTSRYVIALTLNSLWPPSFLPQIITTEEKDKQPNQQTQQWLIHHFTHGLVSTCECECAFHVLYWCYHKSVKSQRKRERGHMWSSSDIICECDVLIYNQAYMMWHGAGYIH